MKNIQIQKTWWSDPRRILMEIKIGFKSTGTAVQLWTVAQWYAETKNTHSVPLRELRSIDNWDYLLSIGLMVSIDPNTVYICGSKEYFPLKSRVTNG